MTTSIDQSRNLSPESRLGRSYLGLFLSLNISLFSTRTLSIA